MEALSLELRRCSPCALVHSDLAYVNEGWSLGNSSHAGVLTGPRALKIEEGWP